MLARRGFAVVVFEAETRPELLVGESMLPGVIPYLEEMQVEEEVRRFSVYKPGATITWNEGESASFDFSQAQGSLAPFAYNTPRAEFDRALLDAAREAGASVVTALAEFEVRDDAVKLVGKSAELAEQVLGQPPDLLVDASGRARCFARLLGLEVLRGHRKDTALFAHMDRTSLTHEGHIHVDRFDRGWAWRIPLGSRVSMGIVANKSHLGEGTAADQFDRLVAEEPAIRVFAGDSTRLTPVVRYTNYQVASARWVGPGWALLGDAAGFIDPVFSTGVYLAMRGASRLAAAIELGSPAALSRYERLHRREMELWKRVIDCWYDGRLCALIKAGQGYGDSWVVRLVRGHITKHVTRVFTGETSMYGVFLLQLLGDSLLTGHRARDLSIR